MKMREYIELKTKEMEAEGITVRFVKKVAIPYGGPKGLKVNGYFCDVDKDLGVATDKTLIKWFIVFVHEYCHFRQWVEKDPLWGGSELKGVDATELIDDWVAKKIELDSKTLRRAVKLVLACELDCEKRVIKEIEKFDLPMDLKAYTQRGNAYAYFYNTMAIYRKWYTPGKEPYNLRKVWSKMPDKFMKNYDEMPLEWYLLFKENCF